MAKEKALYFSHDYHARNDRKIAPLVRDYKSAGYGIYWCAAEMMHEEGGDMEFDEITISAIAKDLNEDICLVKEVIERCISGYQLFFVVDQKLTARRVIRNLDKKNRISEQRSRAGKAAHDKQPLTNAEQMPTSEQQPSAFVIQLPTSTEQLPIYKIKEEERKEEEKLEKEKPDKPPEKKMTKEDFDSFQAKILQDAMFLEPLMMGKGVKTKMDMLGWIRYFNVHIATEEKLDKDFMEYKRHFQRWFVKWDTSMPPPLNGATITTTIPQIKPNDTDKYRKLKVNV